MKHKNPVYESTVEFNPMTKYYNESELFNAGMFDKVRYLRTKIVNGDYVL